MEAAIEALPEVEDCGVVAVVDETGQEHLVAMVVPREMPAGRDEEDAWMARVRGRLEASLGARRMPTRIVIRDKIPRNDSGKLAAGVMNDGVTAHE